MDNILKIKLSEYRVGADILDNLASEYYGVGLEQQDHSVMEIEFKDSSCMGLFKKIAEELYKTF